VKCFVWFRAVRGVRSSRYGRVKCVKCAVSVYAVSSRLVCEVLSKVAQRHVE